MIIADDQPKLTSVFNPRKIINIAINIILSSGNLFLVTQSFSLSKKVHCLTFKKDTHETMLILNKNSYLLRIEIAAA